VPLTQGLPIHDVLVGLNPGRELHEPKLTCLRWAEKVRRPRSEGAGPPLDEPGPHKNEGDCVQVSKIEKDLPLDLELVVYCEDSRDTVGSDEGHLFVRITIDDARQGYVAIFYNDAN